MKARRTQHDYAPSVLVSVRSTAPVCYDSVCLERTSSHMRMETRVPNHEQECNCFRTLECDDRGFIPSGPIRLAAPTDGPGDRLSPAVALRLAVTTSAPPGTTPPEKDSAAEKPRSIREHEYRRMRRAPDESVTRIVIWTQALLYILCLSHSGCRKEASERAESELQSVGRTLRHIQGAEWFVASMGPTPFLRVECSSPESMKATLEIIDAQISKRDAIVEGALIFIINEDGSSSWQGEVAIRQGQPNVNWSGGTPAIQNHPGPSQ